MKIGHEKPVDAVAGRVVSSGESFEYRTNDSTTDSATPLPIKPPTGAMVGSSGFVDLTGVRFGRLIVIGISATKKARWVCRCACGNYTLRTSGAIKAGADDASCSQCYLLAVAKREDVERRTGKRVEIKSFY